MTSPSTRIDAGFDLRVQDLGRMPYGEALDLQRRLQQEVIQSRCPDGLARIGHLLLLEHDPPVITVSRRKTARRHLVATPHQLAEAGVEVAATDRGGDITYHGPGQLVAYPILDLNRLDLRLSGYMRWLEAIVIGTLGGFGIKGQRDPEATGVWVGGRRDEGSEGLRDEGAKRRGDERERKRGDEETERRSAESGRPVSKICALGVRVSRWVSMHGLALNVTTDLAHFDLIVPCGLAGRRVTSMRKLLGDGCPTMHEVKRALAEKVRDAVRESAA